MCSLLNNPIISKVRGEVYNRVKHSWATGVVYMTVYPRAMLCGTKLFPVTLCMFKEYMINVALHVDVISDCVKESYWRKI